ncbi:MAP kinase-activated protein kinase 2 (Fragment) [Seminavis robusta]|uniref:MAP kinase-activated protein kinase 2 n=1 Tax=Seminavis robusta TaxID=568900 RepID=A0A9N8EJN9_9STRA
MIDGVTFGEGNALGIHPEGKTFSDCYTLLQRIGSGSFGEVYTTELKDKSVDSSQYACKIIDRTKLKKESDLTVFRELAILRDIRDLDNVTRLKDCFVTKTHVHVVQTLCRGGDVFEQLSKQKTYTEHDARDLARTLFSVMELLHLRRLAHRDLKPENLLLVSRMQASQVVVADFGMAQYVPKSGGFLSTRCGTPAFVAPEVVAGRHYNTQVDMWSIGTLLFMLLGGKPPFADTSFQGLFRKIQAADYDFSAPQWKQVSIPAKQCLASLLRVDPYYRATASEALQSAWFTATTDDQLRGNDLTSSVRELKSWVAKRRFKSAVHAVRLTSHFSRFVVKDHSSLLQKVKAWDTDGDEDKSNQKHNAGTPLLSQWKGKTQNFDELYEIQDEIARGEHCTVYKCVRKKPTSGKKLGDQETLAVKMIPRNSGSDVEQAVLHEVAVMQNLKHPAMVQIVDFLEDTSNYYVILEHVPGVSVMEHLMRMQLQKKKPVSFTEQDARAIVEPLLQVIAYIHGEGVVHRDLSLDNVLMVDADASQGDTKGDKKSTAPIVKLCDFGLARRVPAPRSVTRCCGQPLYMAPEVVKHIPYDQSADMWSIGVLLYMLLCGTPPFAAATEKELFAKIRLGKWAFPPHIVNTGAISDAAEELVRKLLVPEPLQRWTAEEALRCKWFKEDESSLSSIDLSKSLPKLRDLKSKFKSVAKVVMKLTPTCGPGEGYKRPSIRTPDGLVMDAEGHMLGKEVELEAYRATTMFFSEDPEQKVDDPAKMHKVQTNDELGLPGSQTDSAKHIV